MATKSLVPSVTAQRGYNSIDSLFYAVHCIPVTYLFYNWKSVSLFLIGSSSVLVWLPQAWQPLPLSIALLLWGSPWSSSRVAPVPWAFARWQKAPKEAHHSPP